MLWSAAVTKGYACPFRPTFRQALELGGHVEKGESSEPVVFASSITRTETAPRVRRRSSVMTELVPITPNIRITYRCRPLRHSAILRATPPRSAINSYNARAGTERPARDLGRVRWGDEGYAKRNWPPNAAMLSTARISRAWIPGGPRLS